MVLIFYNYSARYGCSRYVWQRSILNLLHSVHNLKPVNWKISLLKLKASPSTESKMERNVIPTLIAASISFLIALRAYRRKSLDLSGALSGFLVMFIHFALGYRSVSINFSIVCLNPIFFVGKM